MHSLGCTLLSLHTWETDSDNNDLVKSHFPSAQAHLDFTQWTADQVLALLPEDDNLVVITAGPPCPDFSRILGSEGKGASGTEGQKFVQFSQLLNEITTRLRHPYITLVENVVFHNHQEAKEFDTRLGLGSAVLDAKDFGAISRPRLWWTNLPWQQWATGDQGTPCPIRITKYNNHTQVKIPAEGNDLDRLELGPYKLHPSTHSLKFACLTTPAPTDRGRPAPKANKKKPSSGALQRWTADNKTFAPWHYELHNMVLPTEGPPSPSLPPLEVKEQLHHLPIGYTSKTGWTSRKRGTALANGWHVGVARFLLWLLLQQATANNTPSQRHTRVFSENRYLREHPCTTTTTSVPRNPRQHAVFLACRAFLNTSTPFGPCPPRKSHNSWEHLDDFDHHFAAAQGHSDSPRPIAHLDPSIHYALKHQQTAPHHLVQWREAVLNSLDEIIEESQQITEHWLDTCPSHTQRLYRQEWAPHGTVQIPTLIQILQWLDFPQANQIQQELTQGFQMLGDLTPGVGWPRREDSNYQNPICMAELFKTNAAYIQQKSHQTHSRHWAILLQDILQDRSLSRIEGPFQAPANSNFSTVTVQGLPLLPCPDENPLIAVAFPIIQTGSDGQLKIRRGEDWRRSGHNSTISAVDAPYHHTIDHYIEITRQLHHLRRGNTGAFPENPQSHTQLLVWGHDHEGAYRQLPVKDQSHCYLLLHTPEGPTLWRHAALLFGAVSSVWAYNRVGDILVLLARVLLKTPAVHFVDDYGGVDPSDTATSAFAGFSSLNQRLGFKMKPSKEQPPATEHKIQGVQLHISQDHITVKPTTDRQDRVRNMIQKSLQSNHLKPVEAATLAGKLNFLATTIAGRVGRAATKLIYQRQHQTHGSHTITPQLRMALEAILWLTFNAPPRRIPLSSSYTTKVPLVYTDAYFLAGDTRVRAKDHQQPSPHPWDNGWGIVIFPRIPGHPEAFYAHGSIPKQQLQAMYDQKAFIYFLETIAMVLGIMITGAITPANWASTTRVTALIDNEAAKCALIKGYGKDQGMNTLLSTFWPHCARHQLHPTFHRVSTKANIADKISRHETQWAATRGWRAFHLDTAPITTAIAAAHGDHEQALRHTSHTVYHAILLQLQTQEPAFRSLLREPGM